ncbi:MAG: UDP-N-acetylglucosamine 1-carboxyvinyltransferase [Lachnospiraceae bacterium]|nr:UDP-N-acetylglucosamine 1-carboxyvinyltransferase [Lachnospiraceae bacterium]
MSEIRICGYRPLSGEIKIQGSKNGVLPMLAASILQKETVKFTNVPTIQDVTCMVGILESLGCRCRWEGSSLTVDASECERSEIPKEDVGKMRSSILVMGALLGRLGRAVTWYPGGCSIGSRPINLHLLAFSRLGARVQEEDGRIEASSAKLAGGPIILPFPSVGATENALLAAVLAEGETQLLGAAREPEIQSLCLLLNQMGADITGIGTSKLRIRGVRELHGTEYSVPGDRIAAGTYLTAVAAAGGQARLLGAPWDSMQEVVKVLRQVGAEVEPVFGIGENQKTNIEGISISMEGRPKPITLSTSPYPGFPTDLQSPMLAVLARAEGVSRLKETVFEARFKTANELWKMGADIEISGNEAVISGKHRLRGARVSACDLRGGAALVAAALAAEGETRISDCIHIERGYEDICRDIQGLQGRIQRIP